MGLQRRASRLVSSTSIYECGTLEYTIESNFNHLFTHIFYTVIEQDNRKLAYAMNAAVFHLRLIDQLDDLVIETSDLAIYWYDLSSFT